MDLIAVMLFIIGYKLYKKWYKENIEGWVALPPERGARLQARKGWSRFIFKKSRDVRRPKGVAAPREGVKSGII